jgi:hypothetical protein
METRMAESRSFIQPSEILGVRIECKCGVVVGGSVKSLAGKPSLLGACPGCGTDWTSGAESETEQHHNLTAVKTFLSHLNRFQQSMSGTSQRYAVSFEIKRQDDSQKESSK